MALKLGVGLGINVGAATEAFSPEDIAGLTLWFDAADESTITESGGSVSQWDDKSGGDYHAIQPSGANQMTTGIATQNGRNVLSSTSQSFYIPDTAGFELASAETTFFVAYRQDNSIASIFRLSGSNFGFRSRSNGGLQIKNDSGVGNIAMQVFLDTGNFQLLIVRVSGSNIDAFLNDETTPAASNVLGTYVNDGPGNHGVFGVGQTGEPLTGQAGEMLLYTGGLSDTDLQTVARYLKTKWGIT